MMTARCPRPDKDRFPDMPTANTRLVQIWKDQAKVDPKAKQPKSAYPCVCGWIHLSSMTRQEFLAKQKEKTS